MRKIVYILTLFIFYLIIDGEIYNSFLLEKYENQALTYYQSAKFHKAREYYLKAIAIQEKRLDKDDIKLVANYSDISLVYKALGNLKNALKFAKRALNILEKRGETNSLNLATIYNNISIFYKDLGDLESALNFSKKALNIFEKILSPFHPTLASNYGNLATIYQALGDLDNALEFAKKTIAIEEKILDKNHPSFAISYNNISIIYYNLGDFENALTFANKALAIMEKVLGKNHPYLGVNYTNISVIYKDVGDLESALKFSKKSLAIMEKILDENHPNLAGAYNNIAVTYADLGNFENALNFYKKSLNIMEKILDENHPDLATIYANIASNYHSLKDLKNALEFSYKALIIQEKILDKNHHNLAINYHNISMMYQDLGDLENALIFAKKDLNIVEKIFDENNTYVASSYTDIAMVYKDLKDFKNALEFSHKALNIKEKVLNKNHFSLSISYYNTSLIYLDLGDYQNAYRYIKKALDIQIDNINSIFSLSNENQRYKYLKNNRHVINTFLNISFNSSNKSPKEVLTSLLNYKGEITSTQNLLLKLKNQTEDNLTKVAIDTLYEINQNYTNLFIESIKDMENPTAYREILKELEIQKGLIEEELGRNLYKLKNQLNLKNIDTKTLSNILTKEELYIDFVKGEDEYYIFTLNSKNEVSFDLLIEFKEEMIDKDSNKTLKNLYDILFKDKIENYKKLIISKDGVLHRFPFETLINPKTNRYLIEEKEITYIPSAKELLRLHNRKKENLKNSNKIVVFANPNFNMQKNEEIVEDLLSSNVEIRGEEIKSILSILKIQSPLKGTKKEAENIKNIFKNSVIIYEQNRANSKNLFNIKSPKILHIATHGFFINDTKILNSQ